MLVLGDKAGVDIMVDEAEAAAILVWFCGTKNFQSLEKEVIAKMMRENCVEWTLR